MAGYSETKRDDMGMVYLIVVALLIGMAYFFWSTSHTDISYYGLHWAWYQLGLVDFQITPEFVRRWRLEAATLALNSRSVTFEQLLSILNRTGWFFVWLPIFFSVRGIKIALTHKANLTRRKVTVETLPWIVSKHSPAIIPSLYYGDKDTLLLNVDPEEHRSSLNPEEWVEQHGLLINGMLDRARCRDLLTRDLGTPIHSLAAMSLQEKALFAVFGARLLSDGRDIKQSQILLDQLNRSCHTNTWNGKKGYPDLTLANLAFAKYSAHPEAQKWLTKHPYPRTLLHSMHKAALKSGRLPSSHFRWLKGMDRALWYALNTTGRKSPFLESAAVFTQALWENFAFDSGYRLTEPCIEDAVNGVASYLIKIGLMAPPNN